MAIGVVSDEDFDDELAKANHRTTAKVVDKPSPGRNEGDNNVPETLQKIIGETSVVEGRKSALELANYLGISPSSVSAYSVGATSTATIDKPKPALKGHLDRTKKRIARSAAAKLKLALDNLTEDKLQDTKARDLSGVARDMAAVMKDMTPDSSNPIGEKGGPSFVIYAPQFRQENHFQTIEVNE